jgi:hypothetical protein
LTKSTRAAITLFDNEISINRIDLSTAAALLGVKVEQTTPRNGSAAFTTFVGESVSLLALFSRIGLPFTSFDDYEVV